MAANSGSGNAGDCALICPRREESPGLGSKPPRVRQAAAYEAPSRQECSGCILLTAPSPLGHFTPQRSGFLSLSLSVVRETWGGAVFLLSSRCSQSWGSDVMSPTSPCCQRGLRSAFITNRPCKHPEVLQARDVPTRVCVLRLPALPRCSAVQYLSGPCGDQLEGDWRINATLKQNTTCQLFTPSLPHGGRMSRFS